MPKQATQEELIRAFQKIHPDLRKAISSATNADTIFEIGKKHGLLIDKTGELAAESGLLMLGITHPDEFVGNLAERLQVDKPKAKTIADDINREIFAPVREHLRSMFGPGDMEQGTRSREQKTPLPPAAVKPMEKQQGKEVVQQPEKTKIPDTKPQEKQGAKEEKSTQLPKELQATNYKLQASSKTSLEDLEAELKKTIAEEKQEEPLNIVKQTSPKPSEQKIDVPRYTGTDPYREQVEDNMPNVKGAPFVMEQGTHTMEQKKKEEKPVQPPPFSPLPQKQQSQVPDKYKEKISPEAASGAKPDGTLKQFRGFNMNTTPQPPQAPQQKPSA